MYVSDSDWQDVVNDLLGKSQFVVLQAGESEGLRWEIERAAEATSPERVLLFVPFELSITGAKRHRERGYQKLREWAASFFPRGLPSELGDAFFIAFRSNPAWEPFVLSPTQAVPADHPHEALLNRLRLDRMFLRPHEYGCLTSLFVLSFASVVLWLLIDLVPS